MDLNPDSQLHARPEVTPLHPDGSGGWRLADESLHVVFSSNFFEHSPSKVAFEKTELWLVELMKKCGFEAECGMDRSCCTPWWKGRNVVPVLGFSPGRGSFLVPGRR